MTVVTFIMLWVCSQCIERTSYLYRLHSLHAFSHVLCCIDKMEICITILYVFLESSVQQKTDGLPRLRHRKL